jgi:hypothetical protein
MCTLPDGKSSVVLDRELDQEKSFDPFGPPHADVRSAVRSPQGTTTDLLARSSPHYRACILVLAIL